MRFFKFTYPSKKTSHPDGQKNISVFGFGTTRKAALLVACDELEKIEKENAQFFKGPSFEEVTKQDYDQHVSETAPSETAPSETAPFNIDSEKGITEDDLNMNVAAVTLFGTCESFDEQQIKEIESFCDKPETFPEFKDFSILKSLVLPYMPQIFDCIDENQLIKFVAQVDHVWLISKGDHDRVKQSAIRYITEDLSLEYQTCIIEHIQEVTESDNAPVIFQEVTESDNAPVIFQEVTESDIDLDVPSFDELPDVCTFNEDLKELNFKINAIKSGESLIIDDLDNNLYHAAYGVSNSTLGMFDRDPALLEWRKNAPVDTSKINTLNLGDAVHTAILEPDQYKNRYAIEPPVLNEDGEPTTKTNKFWKSINSKFIDANKDKTIITNEDDKKIRLMSGSAMAHPTVKKLIDHNIGKPETSIFYRDTETDIIFKIRPDWLVVLNDIHFIIDVKSTPDVWRFDKSIAEFNYHRQDAFYSKIYKSVFKVDPVFAFLAVSKSIELGAYPVRLLTLDDDDKEVGLFNINRIINQYADCNDSGVWGGFEKITRPYWAKKNDF